MSMLGLGSGLETYFEKPMMQMVNTGTAWMYGSQNGVDAVNSQGALCGCWIESSLGSPLLIHTYLDF